MGPHANIHGGRNENRLVSRNEERGGEIAREPCAHFGEQIGGSGDDDEQVRIARQFDMADGRRVGQIKEAGIDLVAGQRAERQRRHEFSARRSQHAAHGCPVIAQSADQLKALIGGNAAADDEQNAAIFQNVRQWVLRSGRLNGEYRVLRPECGDKIFYLGKLVKKHPLPPPP